MTLKKKFEQIFGIGPTGAILTILILSVFYLTGHFLQIPKMVINPTLRTILLSIFIFDSIYLIIGGNYYLRKSNLENKIAMDGPYQFVRHPIYSAWIYSFSGIIALVFYSWAIIISVIPISIIWSWLVQKEEQTMLRKFGNDYANYMNQTGQFLPSLRSMKNKLEEQK